MIAACIFVSMGESQLPPASLGGSPRSANGFDSHYLPISASLLRLSVCEILHRCFKSGVCFPQSSSSFIGKPLWLSKLNILGPCFPNGGTLGWAGKPNQPSEPLLPWGEPLQLSLSSSLQVAHLGRWVLTVPCLCPSNPSHCGSFLISSVVENLCCQSTYCHHRHLLCKWL